jgi:hypothetical protein
MSGVDLHHGTPDEIYGELLQYSSAEFERICGNWDSTTTVHKMATKILTERKALVDAAVAERETAEANRIAAELADLERQRHNENLKAAAEIRTEVTKTVEHFEGYRTEFEEFRAQANNQSAETQKSIAKLEEAVKPSKKMWMLWVSGPLLAVAPMIYSVLDHTNFFKASPPQSIQNPQPLPIRKPVDTPRVVDTVYKQKKKASELQIDSPLIHKHDSTPPATPPNNPLPPAIWLRQTR